MKKLVTTWLTILTLAASPSITSAITNGGFETGDFTGWSTIGVASIETVAYGAGPTQGSYQALVVSEDGSLVSDSDIEEFLGLPAGTLDGFLFDDDATAGSAIKRTITVNEGDVLSFDFNFLTDETEEGDFAFVSLSTGFVDVLAEVGFTAFFTSSTPFSEEGGFAMYSGSFSNAGTYTLGFGVMHVGDNEVASGLLLDNVVITPEPATVCLLGLGALSLIRRKR
jgi:hypothetical protein